MSSRLRNFVVINKANTSAPLDHSAAVELADTDKGLLPNRLTTAQRNAIPNPASGLLIFNTTTGAYEFYNGSSWGGIGSGNNGIVKLASGTITTPVAFFDLTLPAGYELFRLQLMGVTTQNDYTALGFSKDNGVTFFNDTVHSDSYTVTLFYYFHANSLTQFDAVDSTGKIVNFYGAPGVNFSLDIFPGDNINMAGFRFDGFQGGGFSSGYVGLNSVATVPIVASRINLIRILPYGAGDLNPPTSGLMVSAGSYILWGVTP